VSRTTERGSCNHDGRLNQAFSALDAGFDASCAFLLDNIPIQKFKCFRDTEGELYDGTPTLDNEING
jgi:hypothetical protein